MALRGIWGIRGAWQAEETESGLSIQTRSVTLTVQADSVTILESIPVFSDSLVQWNQVAGEEIDLKDRNEVNAYFTSPSNFTHDSVLVFRVVEVKDLEFTSDYMYITVLRATEPGKRVQSIIDRARVTLGDKNGDRYSDSSLLILMNEGQEEFCKRTKILRGISTVPLFEGKEIIDLPEDCWRLTRASYNNAKLPLLTYGDVDSILSNSNTNQYKLSYKWEDEYGEPRALIYDKNDLGQARIYPIPEAQAEVIPTSYFGVLAGIDEALADGSVSTNYGTTSDIVDAEGILRVYYTRMPEEVNQLSDELSIPKMFDIALKYYIVAHSFLNDLDGGWQEKGMQQLRFYEQQVEEATISTSTNHTSSNDRVTHYRNGF